MYQRVDGKPCHIVWFLKAWRFNKATGEYDLVREKGLHLTKDAAVAELHRRRVTQNARQYSLYEGVAYKGEVIRERKLMVKDSTGVFEDEEPEDYE